MIGIDAGTFHTVAVRMHCDAPPRGDVLRFPQRSIPSIAFRSGDTPVVGVDAIPYLDSDREIILAPKLQLAGAGKDLPLLQRIIRKLVYQALQDLGVERPGSAVMTVPPSWTLEHCRILKESIEPLVPKISFLHEPIAMVLGAIYLAPQYDKDLRLAAKLDRAELALICDWGAGTVDVALVRINRAGKLHEFSCLGEVTELDQGGTAIARDVVRDFQKSRVEGESAEKNAYRLQAHWAGDVFPGRDFSGYEPLIRKRRSVAAEVVAQRVSELLDSFAIEDRGKILCILHGGPLESPDLKLFFQEKLAVLAKLSAQQFLHIGNEFASGLSFDTIPWRRDVLVASGAALFAARGKIQPEFEYRISLRNARGELASSVMLALGPNLAGIQIVEPPNTGSDYYVEVQQLRRSPDGGDLVPTSIKAELAHYVRPRALVKYCILGADVGYACIEAREVTDTMEPGDIPDAKYARVFLPEKCTRFSIELE